MIGKSVRIIACKQIKLGEITHWKHFFRGDFVVIFQFFLFGTDRIVVNRKLQYLFIVFIN